METPDKSNGHAGDGETIEHLKVPTITIMMDPRTHQVSVQVNDIAISVVQMMLNEATIQMDSMRRQAAALELAARAQKAAQDQALFDRIAGRK